MAILKNFLPQMYTKTDLLAKGRRVRALVVWVQQRARLQFATKYSKVEVLQSYWKTLVSDIAKKASKRTDGVKSYLVSSMLQIPRAVQVDCLKHYVRRCK